MACSRQEVEPDATKEHIKIKNELILKSECETGIDISHLLKKDFDTNFDIDFIPSVGKSEINEDIFVTDIVNTEDTPINVNRRRKKKATLKCLTNSDVYATDITEKLNTTIIKKRRKRNDLTEIVRKNSILDNIEKPKRKVKRLEKDTNDKDEEEKEKQSIECEFCHKVLTSKLSLRNHYKIHTGFDVVCEVGVIFYIVKQAD